MDATQTTELVERFRWVPCELEEHFVPHDASARYVPASGFSFSPGSQFTKDRSPFGLQRVPSPNSLIAFLRLPTLFSHYRFEPCKLLTRPFQTSECFQAILQMCMDGQEEFDIFQRVRDLVSRKRSRAPIGKGMGFRQFRAVEPLDQVRIGNLGAIPDHGRGDLGIKKRLRDLSCMEGEQIEVLPAG